MKALLYCTHIERWQFSAQYLTTSCGKLGTFRVFRKHRILSSYRKMWRNIGNIF